MLHSISRLFRRSISSHRISQEELTCLAFQQDVKAIDPKVLAAAMGGNDEPPEERLLATTQEGFGYHTAAAVGRRLRDYAIVRKLGWATTSSVWLALDQSAKTTTYVAMKVLTSQASAQFVPGHALEHDVYKKIKVTNPKHPGFNHCLTLRHGFLAKSEAGYHLCFVTDVLGPSVRALREPGQNKFTLPIAKRITKQVLLALDYLHRECGYIHTDIKSDNILVSIPQPVMSRIHKYIWDNPPAIYGPPLILKSAKLPIIFSCSEPLPYFILGGSIEDISVHLVDYGHATPVDRDPRPEKHLRQPSIIRAPEVTLKYPWTSAIDIWTVGCLLFELLTERHLFDQDHDTYSHELHLQYIVACLGPFPPEFLKGCEDREKYFDDKGALLHTNNDFAPTSLEDILRTVGAVDETEIPGVAAFLRRCLTLDPKLRPSAQELLEDSWLG